jgi:hypothetical protein
LKIKQLLLLLLLLLLLPTLMSIAQITNPQTQTQTQTQTQIQTPTNIISEYLVVSGTFNQSIKIWQERWKLYNGTIKSINNSDVINKLGYYVKQPYTINKNKCYKQINGNNYIWFGHKLNPVNSYDAWYIGNSIEPTQTTQPTETTETNSLITPLTPLNKLSIPCSPTFLPNNNGINTLTIFYTTNITIISQSDPSIQRLFLSQSELAELIKLNSHNFDLSNLYDSSSLSSLSEINNSITKMSVNNINNLLTITIKTSVTPANPLIIDVYRSTDLVNDEFKLLYSNIVVNTPKFEFNLPLNGNIGFFKIVYK